MTWGGWIIMLASVGGTTVFFIWCIRRVLREPDATHKIHGQIDIETPDRKDHPAS
jgi:hypothetical protein